MKEMFFRYQWIFATGGVLVLTAVILHEMGRVLYCKCGYVKLWQGIVASSENSQHISDWYSFSHLIHGIIFCAIAYAFLRRYSVGFSLFIATVVEAAWEIFENTDFIINRYREITISWDYYGDSILNSTFDILFMILGFWLALRLPWWVSLLIAVVLELFVGYMIRDNLTLNVIMLLHPFEGIKTWQSAG